MNRRTLVRAVLLVAMFASAGVVLEGALATDDRTLNRLDDDEHLGDLVGQDVAGSTGGWTVIATQGADNRGYSAELVALDEDDVDVLAAWTRTHKNDDETVVHVVDVGGTYLASAVDLDDEGEVLETATVATSVTPDEAVERARRWCEKNPKGLQGDGGLASLLGG